MTVRSIQDHVQALIGRRVAEAKVDGAPSPDIEARAILESITLNLLLKPKAVLYLAHLARNSLISNVTNEITAIDSLVKTIDDLANTTYQASDTQYLEKARTSLLQMESLEKVNTEGAEYKRFSRSIDDFLNKTISKNVRRIGSTELLRASSEASTDLPTDFESVEALHATTVQRLMLLSVGIENFTRSSLGTVLGLTTAYRARQDIEDVISIIESGDSESQSRDIVIRLIGNRAALKTTASLPSMSQPLIQTGSFPPGQTLYGRSVPTSASMESSVGPFSFSTNGATVDVNGTAITVAQFPQTTFSLANRAFVASTAISYPVMVPASTYVFVHLSRVTVAAGYVLQPDGTYLKQLRIPITAGLRTLAQILTDLNTGLGADGVADEYVIAGTDRIILVANSPIFSISISPLHTQPSATPGDYDVFTDSRPDFFGFRFGQTGVSGVTPIEIVRDAFSYVFGSLITASIQDDQSLLLSSLNDDPGVTLAVSADPSLGLPGVTIAESPLFELYGVVLGSDVDPIDPTPLVDVGDRVILPGSVRTISALSNTRITLSAGVDTFDGPLTVLSGLQLAIDSLDSVVQGFMSSWMGSKFSSDLTVVDRVIAVLNGRTTTGARNAAKDLLAELKTLLQSLLAVLQTGPVPSTLGVEERQIVDGIIQTLEERKYDRALALLLELNIPAFLEMSGDTASFGGNALRAMSDFATTDIDFPNTEADQDSGFKALIKEPEA